MHFGLLHAQYLSESTQNDFICNCFSFQPIFAKQYELLSTGILTKFEQKTESKIQPLLRNCHLERQWWNIQLIFIIIIGRNMNNKHKNMSGLFTVTL